MSNKNFAGQKLDGRSFRGQDLRGADFSGCQLKGCDFRGANLSGAVFAWAVLGVEYKYIIRRWLMGVILSLLSGFVGSLSGFMLFVLWDEIKGVDRFLVEPLIFCVFTIFYGSCMLLSIWLSLRQKKWRIVIGCWLVLSVILGTAAGMGKVKTTGGSGNDIAGTVAAVGAASLATVMAGSIVVLGAAGAGAGAGVDAVVVVEGMAGAAAAVVVGNVTGAVAVAVVVLACTWLLTGLYLRHVALRKEPPMLLGLRDWILRLECWGGTQFSEAVLAHADFSHANVRHANFFGARLHQTIFAGASFLNMAYTKNMVLASRAVRVLLTEGKLESRDFMHHNLRGLSLVGLTLEGCNFYHADLSYADLSGCDLRQANFTEAMVLGTRFDCADLSGAIIDNWSMDKQTQFDGVVCDHVYTRRDKSSRNPPYGIFKLGEFSKLYQEIANTVDFIVHTPEELQALLRAIESIKQQGGEIVIQSLERKNESVVVRTQSPEAIDKAAIYAQVREEMDSQIQLLKSEHEKQLLTQRIELGEMYHDKTMDSLIKMASQFNRPSSIIMNDHSRTISNSTLTNSATNLGDNSTVSNNVIEQVADAQLRTDLQKLHELLTHSTLPADDKKQAQQSVTELAQASEKPAAERKSMARRSLAFLKELREDLGSMADLGVQYGETLARVVLWFQGL